MPTARSRFSATDWGLMLGLMLSGLLLRLRWWSGYGLADDGNFKGAIEQIVNAGVLANAYGYRATWWLPTALLCRALGFTEAALILPITAISTLGSASSTCSAQPLGPCRRLIAALLLIVHPVDFAWSTMLANDMFQSFFAALCMLLFLPATEPRAATSKRRLIFSRPSASSWLSLQGDGAWPSFPCSGDRLVASRAAPARGDDLRGRRRAALRPGRAGLDRAHRRPLWTVQIEMWLGGLRAPDAAALPPSRGSSSPPTRAMLFTRNQLGDLAYSVYPHLLVLFALLAWPLRLRSSKELWVWLLVVFCILSSR